MKLHPAITPGNVAVITGGADGIGFTAARYFKEQGMDVCIADISEEKLAIAADALGDVLVVKTDVANLADLEALKSKAYERFGQVDVLMNNAGVASHCGSWSDHAAWKQTLDVNLWGVINGVHTFTAAMIEQGTPGLIINTGSKQGITTPPGNPAYNVSKAGIKAATEALAHELRNTEACQVSAHLLVPGFTYTGMVKVFLPEKPDGAWWPEQVIDFLMTSLARRDFYIICPDNDATQEMDGKRMAWAIGDIIENRPALSRWHPDHQDAFARFMEE